MTTKNCYKIISREEKKRRDGVVLVKISIIAWILITSLWKVLIITIIEYESSTMHLYLMKHSGKNALFKRK